MSRKLSRADRFSLLQNDIINAKDGIETLRDELQDWLDNIPENLQGGSKAEQLEETIDELDTIIDSLDEAGTTDINFPGMR